MSEPRRRYFVATDAEALQLNATVLQALADHKKRVIEFFASYGTTLGMTSDGWPTSVFLKEGDPIPDGLRGGGLHSHAGETYISCVPFGSTKAARAFKAKAKVVGRVNPSDMILKHYSANAMIWAAGYMWKSVGHTKGAGLPITLSVPEDEENPYTPHPSFREIKKSEYVAITEE